MPIVIPDLGVYSGAAGDVVQSELVERIRILLQDEPFESYITADPSTGTTVAVADGTDWNEGDVMEFSDGDLALVYSVNSNNVTVKRSHMGTTAAAHTASGATAVIKKNPTYYYKDIVEAVDRTIHSLWPYAWKTKATTITPDTTTKWFNLATDFIDPITVNQLYGSSSQYVGFYGPESSLVVKWKKVPTALCASGWGMNFPGGFYHASNTIYVDYRAQLSNTVAAGIYSDLTEGVLTEAITYGAAARLAGSRELVRVNRDDISQSDTAVEPAARLRAAFSFEQRFKELLNQYHDRLLRSSGPMN